MRIVNQVLFYHFKIAMGDSLHLDVHRNEVSSFSLFVPICDLALGDGKELSVPK